MTLSAFRNLSNRQQLKKLFHDGYYLATQDFDEFNTALFYCEGYFVEIVYTSDTLETIRLNSSAAPIQPERYFNQVSLAELEI